MKQLITGTVVAAAFAVGLSAQTPPQGPPAQENKDAAKQVTVTGCLKAGETPESFLLSDLKWNQDRAVGTSGSVAPSTPAPAITATALKLIPSASGPQLSEHIGRQVEVTGTIDKADKAMGSAADPAARPAPSAASQPSLNVRNVKMVAATCTGQ